MLALELKSLQNKFEQEAAAHREDVDTLTADKKRILSSTEEAKFEQIQGKASCFCLSRRFYSTKT